MCRCIFIIFLIIFFKDFDIAGQYDLMVPEAECLKIIDEVFTQLDIGNYQIKVDFNKRLKKILR